MNFLMHSQKSLTNPEKIIQKKNEIQNMCNCSEEEAMVFLSDLMHFPNTKRLRDFERGGKTLLFAAYELACIKIEHIKTCCGEKTSLDIANACVLTRYFKHPWASQVVYLRKKIEEKLNLKKIDAQIYCSKIVHVRFHIFLEFEKSERQMPPAMWELLCYKVQMVEGMGSPDFLLIDFIRRNQHV